MTDQVQAADPCRADLSQTCSSPHIIMGTAGTLALVGLRWREELLTGTKTYAHSWGSPSVHTVSSRQPDAVQGIFAGLSESTMGLKVHRTHAVT